MFRATQIVESGLVQGSGAGFMVLEGGICVSGPCETKQQTGETKLGKP